MHIDLKTIRHQLAVIFRKALKILKEVKKLPNFKTYILLSVVFTVLFVFITFPYDALIRKQLQAFGENAGRSASIGKIDAGFFGGTEIRDFVINLKNGAEISIDKIELDMGIFSALFSKSFSGETIISGMEYNKENTAISINGKCDFDLKFESFSDYPSYGKIKMEIQNAVANGVTIKDFGIPPVRFSQINANLDLQKGRMNITDFNFSGPDLKGSIKGTLTLAKFFIQSQLNLNITVDSDSALLENYKVLLGKWIDASNMIQLTIRGSVMSPRVDSENSSGAENPGTVQNEPDNTNRDDRPEVRRKGFSSKVRKSEANEENVEKGMELPENSLQPFNQ